MAQHNFLKIASADSGATFDIKDLPDARTLSQLSQRAEDCLDKLRLVKLDQEQLAHFGNASTPEEVRLNQRYARLTRRFPQLMDHLKRPRDQMQDAFESEQALVQLKGMFRQIRSGGRAACILLAADLTEKVDRIEGTVMRRMDLDSDTALKEKAALRGRFSSPEEARNFLYERAAGRQQRAALRERQASESIARAQATQAALAQEETLRAAVIPEVSAASSKKLGKKGGKAKSKKKS